MKKYPKIKRIGDEQNSGILSSGRLYVQEKLDGANFRFTRQRNIEEEYHDEGRDLVFGSRNIIYKNEKDVDDNFWHAIEFVREQIELAPLSLAEDHYGSLVFYGEAMHPHTLDYNWDEIPSFIGFDIYSVEHEEFLGYADMEHVFDSIGLQQAPVLYCGPAEEYVDDTPEVPESEYRNGIAEGIVIKNLTTGQRAKVRSEKFKEKHGLLGQSNTPEEYEPTDAEVLAQTYTTEARVLKMIHKMDDEGHDIEMAMMEDLWRRVFDDIIEEEYTEIFLGNHTIDTKEFRSEVANRCAMFLQQYLERPDESVLNKQ